MHWAPPGKVCVCARSGRLGSQTTDPPAVQPVAETTTSDIRPLLEPLLPRLQRYARTLTGDSSRADDLVQDCVVRALVKQHQWRDGSDLRAWLFAILHNVFITEVRRCARERAHLQTINFEPVTLPGSDPELSCWAGELRDALSQLPARQRQIVMQIGVESRAYDDAASALGIPVGTVRSRLARARASLRAITGHQPQNDGGG